jgi:hypothetical protein
MKLQEKIEKHKGTSNNNPSIQNEDHIMQKHLEKEKKKEDKIPYLQGSFVS